MCVITTLHKILKSSKDYNVWHILYCGHFCGGGTLQCGSQSTCLRVHRQYPKQIISNITVPAPTHARAHTHKHTQLVADPPHPY